MATRIKQVVNKLEDKSMFVKLEDTSNNRYLPSGQPTDVGNCTVPKCNSEEDFLKKTIIITDLDNPQVIAYIWYGEDKDGDAVRCSTDGWHASGHKLPGCSEVGINLDIIIDTDGKVYGKQVD